MKFTFSAGAKPFEGYTIKRAIHRGGFGEVYYALTDGGKEVALKLLHDNMDIELRGVSQCLNLKHPHLVNIFDIKTDAQGDHWIVMEYVAGGTLADIIAEHPEGLPQSQVIEVFKQCSQGLAFLHDRGLVHRDLKPANIFSEDGILKIGDVGLTKFISQTHRSGHTQSVGTVYYMAPEVARGNYGKGVDIYAMGVIAYEMLTGQVPFDGESTGEILMKHLTEKPDLSRFDAPLAKVLGRALEKDEQNRFDSIQDFQRGLAAALSGTPVPTLSVEKATSCDKNSDDSVYVANKNSAIPDLNETRKASLHAEVVTHAEPPLMTQERFEAWWWIPALVGFSLLLTKNLFASILFSGFIAGSVYCFRKCYSIGNDGTIHRTTQKPCGKEQVQSWEPSPSPKLERSSRTLTTDMLRGIALAPLIVLLIAASILLISSSFFSSAWVPESIDLAHVCFFVASSTFLVWMLMLCNRLLYSNCRKDSSFRLFNGTIGMLCGAAVFGMGQWFIVEYPHKIFPNGSSGLISNIGQHALVSEEESYLSRWNNEKWNQPSSSETQTHTASDSIDSTVAVSTLPIRAQDSAWGSVESSHDNETRNHSEMKTHWSPTIAGYAMFFGFLFAMRSWWRLGNSNRQHRFRLSSVVLTAMIAYVICCIFTFPTVWAMTWAATIAATIQLASPCKEFG